MARRPGSSRGARPAARATAPSTSTSLGLAIHQSPVTRCVPQAIARSDAPRRCASARSRPAGAPGFRRARISACAGRMPPMRQRRSGCTLATVTRKKGSNQSRGTCTAAPRGPRTSTVSSRSTVMAGRPSSVAGSARSRTSRCAAGTYARSAAATARAVSTASGDRPDDPMCSTARVTAPSSHPSPPMRPPRSRSRAARSCPSCSSVNSLVSVTTVPFRGYAARAT